MTRLLGSLFWRKHIFKHQVFLVCPVCGHLTSKVSTKCPNCETFLKGVQTWHKT